MNLQLIRNNLAVAYNMFCNVFSFFNNSGYKEYLENAVAFNRKLNEERKMRIPYIDGQGPIYKTLFYLTLKKAKIFLVLGLRCTISLHLIDTRESAL